MSPNSASRQPANEEVERPFLDVGVQLERLARLIALTALRNTPQAEQIVFLSRAGFLPKEIAQLLGTTPNTVSVTLSQQKSKSSKKATKKR